MALSRIKTLLIFAGDVIIYYLSLAISLYLRQIFGQSRDFDNFFKIHIQPFSIILIIWLLVFYLANLYNPQSFKNGFNLYKVFGISVLVSGALSAIAFYLFPFFGITPKTNLFIFILVFGILGFFWRYFFNLLNNKIGTPENVILIAPERQSSAEQELVQYLKNNPQLGYKIMLRLSENALENGKGTLAELISKEKISLIVFPPLLENKEKTVKAIFNSLSVGVQTMGLCDFYELILKKAPLSELEESWFLENITQKHQIYDGIKRGLETISAFILIIVLSPLLLLIFLLIKLTSRGPAILNQSRVGKNKVCFSFYKFRSMRQTSPQGLLDQNSAVMTPIGKILRKTHLDELPQLFNILRGDLSFIGPRPDLLDYYKDLKDKINFYETRTIIKPGITGWAQVSYPITITLEQTAERLAYDLFYLKNRSFMLDLVILIRTIRTIFTASGF